MGNTSPHTPQRNITHTALKQAVGKANPERNTIYNLASIINRSTYSNPEVDGHQRSLSSRLEHLVICESGCDADVFGYGGVEALETVLVSCLDGSKVGEVRSLGSLLEKRWVENIRYSPWVEGMVDTLGLSSCVAATPYSSIRTAESVHISKAFACPRVESLDRLGLGCDKWQEWVDAVEINAQQDCSYFGLSDQ